jgi:PKD repeat protein
MDLSLAPTATASETEQPISFSVTISGATAPYSVLVTFGDGTTAWEQTSNQTVTFVHTYLASGTYAPFVNVTDAVGTLGNASAPAIHLASGPALTAHATPSTGEVGLAVSFGTTLTSGGIPPLTYSWTFGDGGTGGGASPSHPYGTAGSYTVNVTVVDSVGATANASVGVQIVPAPTVSIAPVISQPNTSTVEGFLADISGGVGPYQYSWHLGNGNTSLSPSPVQRYPLVGQYTVSVYVNDSLGGSAHADLVVTVGKPTAPSSGGTSLASAPAWFWAGLGGLVAVGAVGSFYLLRRRHTGS